LFSGINKDIWVVGSSIIQRAGEHSKIRPIGTFLGLQQLGCQLVWVGMPGMKWENVVPLIHPFAIIVFSSMPFKNDCVAAPIRNEWVLNSSRL
jgi:hypothetical protein